MSGPEPDPRTLWPGDSVPVPGDSIGLSSRRFRHRLWLHVALFLATVGTTAFVGGLQFISFRTSFGAENPVFSSVTRLLLEGLWYSAAILGILGAHEAGHYVACRYYAVDASLPYFLPLPFVGLAGTLGAFIKIREPIRFKRALFDIGIAGPLAGFVILVPLLFIGLRLSNVLPVPEGLAGYELGEPLLFKAAARLVLGPIPAGHDINLHPIGFAAWFGMLATALNLLPIWQLDGGHITYAALGRRSTNVTLVSVVAVVLLTFFSVSWIVWAILIVLMLVIFGPRHPPTLDEDVPLDGRRQALALVAVLVFALCFTPSPIDFIGTPSP